MSPDAAVFLVVRGDDGSNIPVAVKRNRFEDLPLSITISDNDAMMPSRTISQMDAVTFEARLSPSGQAKPQAGDWVSDKITVSVKDPRPIKLIIYKPVN